MKIQYTVTVERPEDVNLSDLKEYVRDAINGWSGGFHPEDPRTGITVIGVRRTKEDTSNGHEGRTRKG